MWGATPGSTGKTACRQCISIHAPRVGSDQTLARSEYPHRNFNPRSPCGERRRSRPVCDVRRNFNPRSPCGERLPLTTPSAYSTKFQSTLPVWGATRSAACRWCGRSISIHAPRVGSDWPAIHLGGAQGYFNPRSPCGERPSFANLFHALLSISIHAPRVGSDQAANQDIGCPNHFNPRSPCGERRTGNF